MGEIGKSEKSLIVRAGKNTRYSYEMIVSGNIQSIAYTWILAVFVTTMSFAQIDVPLLNPSFEVPSSVETNNGGSVQELVHSWSDWTSARFPKAALPRVLQVKGGTRYYHQTARDGKIHFGLDTHAGGTWQSVGQELREPLRAGNSYSLSLYACLDPDFSKNRPGSRDIKAKPAIIRVRGAGSYGETGRVLGSSDPVQTEDWELFRIDLKPAENYRYLVIEVYYVPGTAIHYDAHVLIDHLRLVRFL